MNLAKYFHSGESKYFKVLNFLLPLLIACLIAIWMLYIKDWEFSPFLLAAAILWLFMAMSIWANDVANNMWPAVWSKALSLVWAIIIAGIFEAGWALIAGWDVVNTIKWWIINWDLITETSMFINIMMATLFGSALWIVIATIFKAPVSATHSVIWWLIWAWITAVWTQVVIWSKIWAIVASWIISPLMWWVISVTIILAIRKTILNKSEKWEAAKRWVPVFVSIMGTVFWIYLLLKWLKPLLKSNESLKDLVTTNFVLCAGIWIWLITYIWMVLLYRKRSALFKNSSKFINNLFNIPLVFAVALLSFAHGSNDVANAIWPLAAINDVISAWKVSIESVWIPFWVMFIWAVWIASWLAIFWARLIKTVGWEITKLNQTRAFSIALSAAITVLIASALWLPVSSTHIALGWIFWIGLLRERLKRLEWKNKEYIHKDVIKRIVMAWVITLPVSWVISWWVYLWLKYFI